MTPSLFAAACPIRSIPSDLSFVDALAGGLMAEIGADHLALSEMLILLPNRRGCRALQEAFLRLAGERGGENAALLLPRLLPIGDLDEEEIDLREAALGDTLGLAPALAPLRRQMLLARLIQQKSTAEGGMAFAQALPLAQELARLFDQIETEGLDFANFDHLVEDADLARHWQTTRSFLAIVAEHWPAILAAEGAIDPARRRNLLLRRQAELWRKDPPAHPVIVAGSTGSIPASAELMQAVAGLKRGLIVLPGLDRAAAAEVWTAIAEDPSHPQFGLAALLAKLGVAREDVGEWPYRPMESEPRRSHSARSRVVAAAMLPADLTRDWRREAEGIDPQAGMLAMRSVIRIDAESEQDEAGIIALRLREAAKEPAPYRAALVTPDRALARRVAAEMKHWGIAIDDSAGRPLSLTGAGSFFLAIARAAAEDLAPFALLAMLKHELAGAGLAPDRFRQEIAALEIALLRGPRPRPGIDGLKAAFAALGDEASPLTGSALDRVARLWQPIADLPPDADPRRKLFAHIEVAENLAADAAMAGADRLWRGEAGEGLAQFVADLDAALVGAPRLDWSGYADLLVASLAAIAIRPRYGQHPRLFIWGPLEARLQQVDLMILGGLNEGTWPSLPPPDPWMNRTMRKRFGLASPERRIGLSAHDFAQAMNARDVVLTRALRTEGKPTAPSRWLSRLDAFGKILGLEAATTEAARYRGWQVRLDRPQSPAARATRPAPSPGGAFFPDRLSVTRIEILRRDPYAFYAEKILRLRKLPEIDEAPGAGDLGTFLHKILAECAKACPAALPDDAEAIFREIGEAYLADSATDPGLVDFWRQRFLKIIPWLVEDWRTGDIVRRHPECRGGIEIPGILPSFRLEARADRIDLLQDGQLRIVDYKTGSLPSKGDIEAGIAPQLPLEAVIARNGGFLDLPAAEIAELLYIRFPSGRDDPETKDISVALAEKAARDLARLIALYRSPGASYPAVPDERRYNDYAHLERIGEWRIADDEG